MCYAHLEAKINYILYPICHIWASLLILALLIPSDPEFVQGLRYRFQRVKRDDENIEDVYDGAVYQRKFGPGRFLSEPYNLSLKLNTDGVAIFHSSQFGVWPLFLLVNELPPSLRRKSKYRVFGGLWFGEEKPFFSTFFKPFVDTLQETEIHGKLQCKYIIEIKNI